MTRGLSELVRLAMRKGANPLTLSGLAGMGDLVLTCTGELSRNRTVGLEIGRGKKIKDVLAGMNQVAEGVRTAKSVHELAKKLGLDLPIHDAIYRILYEDLDPGTGAPAARFAASSRVSFSFISAATRRGNVAIPRARGFLPTARTALRALDGIARGQGKRTSSKRDGTFEQAPRGGGEGA